MQAGGCHCGAVRFGAEVTHPAVTVCHCRQCRAWSGHVWGAVEVALSGLHLEGAHSLRWHRSSERARRGFCGDCGASLFWAEDGAGTVEIAAGAFDAPAPLSHGGHIFTAEAGDYYAPEGPPPLPDAPLPERLEGSCLCGACRFGLPGPMGAVTACHCDQCRRLSGYHSASFDADEARLIWRSRTALREYRTAGGARRGFCGDCGSSLYFRAADGAFSIEAGCIAGPTGGRMGAHIFLSPAPGWLHLTDGLPQYPEWEPSDPA